MNPREQVRRLQVLQQSTGFKIGASIVVGLVAIALIAWQLLGAARAAEAAREAREAAAQTMAPEPSGDQAQQSPDEQTETLEDIASGRIRAIDKILATGRDPTSSIVAVVFGVGVALVIIWLGLALTYLALLGAAALVVLLLGRSDATRDWAVVFGGVIALAAAFSALLQGARLALAGSTPVLSIARNVLAEAVRMRVSLVLLAILAFAMASLPGLLSSESALRFRVQSFLQYGTGGSFWIIALLIVLFSVATVAFEQRDKLIWQTMTKPVAPWEYILGKWLGVVTLAAVLLTVVSAGVFLFTEHLRSQKAIGESAPFVSEIPNDIAEDRLILESQVLTARRTRQPVWEYERDSPEFLAAVASYLESQRRSNPQFAKIPGTQEDDLKLLGEIEESLWKSANEHLRVIEAPNLSYDPPLVYFRAFQFPDLAPARSSDTPVVLSYKIDAGTNNPTHFYDLEFRVNLENKGYYPFRRETPVGVRQTVTIPSDAVNQDGVLEVGIANFGLRGAVDASEPIRFPPGGLEVSYTVGSWRVNFLRAMVIFWVKIAALAMVGIACATCLSFPVAVLVALTVFLGAESTSFITTSLESYSTEDRQRNVIIYKWLIARIAEGVTAFFRPYADLKPTTRLVSGQLLSWGTFAMGTMVLMVFTIATYGLSVLIFRRRELATYSGH